jgi:peroxiredoxin
MNGRAASPPAGKHRATRAERRLAARAAQREQARRRRARQNGVSISAFIGGILTVLIVAGVVIYAITRSNVTAATQSNPKGLTDPNAYNPAPSLLSTGTTAPTFMLKSVKGYWYDLKAERGHPVLLEFFATWCPVCHAQAPAIAKLFANYESRGVRFWSILANPYGKDYEDSNRTDLRPADAGDLAWYARTYNVHFPQLVDPIFSVVNQYGIGSYPGIYIIGKAGKIRWASSGQKSYSELAKALNKALAAPAS